MLHGGLERLQEVREGLVGHVDGQKLHGLAVLMQVVAEDHRVIALFLSLDLEVVSVAGQALLLVVVGEGEVQVGGVQLLVDLVVDELVDLGVHENPFSLVGAMPPGATGRWAWGPHPRSRRGTPPLLGEPQDRIPRKPLIFVANLCK